MITTTTVASHPTDVTPTQMAEAITGRPYLSWSQINSFRGCPRAFTFKYIESAAPAFTSSNLLFGGAIHSAIQHHFEQRLEGDAAKLDDLVEAYRVAWRQRVEEQDGVPVRFGKGEDVDTLMTSARNLLESFIASPLAGPAGNVVAIEETLTGSLSADLPDLLAIVDLIWSDDAGLHVLDFKTSRSKWSDAKVSEGAEQLLLYRALASKLAETDTAVHLHYGILVKTKTPSMQLLDVTAEGNPGEHLAGAIRPVWRAMQLGVDFANPSMTGCSGCSFKDRCPAHA